MVEIGDIVKKKGEDKYYIITSSPWRVSENEVVKIAPVPDDGLYLLEELRGCIRVDTLEKVIKRKCENCKWLMHSIDVFDCVCCNTKSIWYAKRGYIHDEHSCCELWEKKARRIENVKYSRFYA